MALFEIVDVPIGDCDFPVRKLLVSQRVKWDDDSTPGCDIDIVEHPGWPSIPRSIQLWVWSGEIDISDPMWPLWGMEYVFFFLWGIWWYNLFTYILRSYLLYIHTVYVLLIYMDSSNLSLLGRFNGMTSNLYHEMVISICMCNLQLDWWLVYELCDPSGLMTGIWVMYMIN